MSQIKLTNIELYGYHGCLKEERKLGTLYIINVTVFTRLDKAAQTDNLKDTVDYVSLYKIVKEEMAIPSNLLEYVVNRILNKFSVFPIKKATVCVSKISPPIGGIIENVSVKMSKLYII